MLSCFKPHTSFIPYPSKEFCFLIPHQPSRRLLPNSIKHPNSRQPTYQCKKIPHQLMILRFNPHTIYSHPYHSKNLLLTSTTNHLASFLLTISLMSINITYPVQRHFFIVHQVSKKACQKVLTDFLPPIGIFFSNKDNNHYVYQQVILLCIIRLK